MSIVSDKLAAVEVGSEWDFPGLFGGLSFERIQCRCVSIADKRYTFRLEYFGISLGRAFVELDDNNAPTFGVVP